MDMNSDTTQVETAPVEQTSTASAAQAGSTAETPAEANEQLRAFYDGKPTDEGTEASAQTEAGHDNRPGTEQPKIEDKDNTPPAEQPPKDDSDAPDQMRPRLKNPDDIAIASIAKAKGIGLAQAADIYRGTSASAIPGMEPGRQAASAEPSASQKLAADIATLEAEIEEERAGEAHLFPAHLKKMDRIADLKNDLRFAKYQEQQTEAAREQNVAQRAKAARDGNLAAVRDDYPTSRDATTPMGTNITKVIAEWQADPAKRAMLAENDAPQLVAAEAASRTALELFRGGRFATVDQALASLKAPATQAASAPTAQQTAAARRVTPAPGSKGQVGGGPPSTLGEVFASVETAEQGNEALMRMFGDNNGGRRKGS